MILFEHLRFNMLYIAYGNPDSMTVEFYNSTEGIWLSSAFCGDIKDKIIYLAKLPDFEIIHMDEDFES